MLGKDDAIMVTSTYNLWILARTVGNQTALKSSSCGQLQLPHHKCLIVFKPHIT